MEDSDVPNLKKTFLSGLHFLIPIFVLIYMLVFLRYTASYSIFYATITLIIVNLINRTFIIQIGKNNWDVETYRNKLEKRFS